jgi:hypothetical protein
MPVPSGELTPQQLADRIRQWAKSQGYTYKLDAHGSEFGKVTLHDPAGGRTTAVIPNAHKGRRLKKHQIRYTVHDLNTHWED